MTAAHCIWLTMEMAFSCNLCARSRESDLCFSFCYFFSVCDLYHWLLMSSSRCERKERNFEKKVRRKWNSRIKSLLSWSIDRLNGLKLIIRDGRWNDKVSSVLHLIEWFFFLSLSFSSCLNEIFNVHCSFDIWFVWFKTKSSTKNRIIMLWFCLLWMIYSLARRQSAETVKLVIWSMEKSTNTNKIITL